MISLKKETRDIFEKVSIFWQRVYTFSAGFALALLLFGLWWLGILIIGGILFSLYVDKKMYDLERGEKK